MKPNADRAFLYARYSPRPEGRTPCESAQAQLERCQLYARLKGLTVADTFPDEEVSGKKVDMADRPQGGRMIRALQKRTAPRNVIIAKLDRGWRNTIDCLQTVAAWDKAGIRLHIVDFGGNAVDTSTSGGRMFLTVLAAMAEWERDTISERTREAMIRHQANGRRMSAILLVPYGWRVDHNGPKIHGKDDVVRPARLVRDDEEQAIIRRIRALAAAGATLRAIARQLTEEGVPTRGGQLKWNHKTVTAILARPTDPKKSTMSKFGT